MNTSTRSAQSSSLIEDIEPSEEKGKPGRTGSKFSEGMSRQLLIAGAVSAISILVLGFVSWSTFSSWRNSPEVQSRSIPVVDSETGASIESFQVPRGATFPFINPATGKATLYPAEACYWTKDGKAKFPPTYVILNERLGKKGPTVCPDCGRNVRLFNPSPPDALMQKAWDEFQRKK